MNEDQQYRIGIYADHRGYALVLSGVDTEHNLSVHDVHKATFSTSEQIEIQLEKMIAGYHIEKIYSNNLKPLVNRLQCKYHVVAEDFVLSDEIFLLNELFANEKVIVKEAIANLIEKERAAFTDLNQENHVINALILAMKDLKYIDYQFYSTGDRENSYPNAWEWWKRGGNESIQSILRDY